MEIHGLPAKHHLLFAALSKVNLMILMMMTMVMIMVIMVITIVMAIIHHCQYGDQSFSFGLPSYNGLHLRSLVCVNQLLGSSLLIIRITIGVTGVQCLSSKLLGLFGSKPPHLPPHQEVQFHLHRRHPQNC